MSKWLVRVRFSVSVAVVYLVTLLLTMYAFNAGLFKLIKPEVIAAPPAVSANVKRPDFWPVVYGKPIRLKVPKVGMDLEVIDGVFNSVDASWNVSPDKAQYATNSAQANDIAGNTFIYGHYNTKVFLPLDHLEVGDTAEIDTDKNQAFFYTLYKVTDTTPQDVAVFNYQGPPILTVQTCSGDWFEMRRFYQFKFERLND